MKKPKPVISNLSTASNESILKAGLSRKALKERLEEQREQREQQEHKPAPKAQKKRKQKDDVETHEKSVPKTKEPKPVKMIEINDKVVPMTMRTQMRLAKEKQKADRKEARRQENLESEARAAIRQEEDRLMMEKIRLENIAHQKKVDEDIERFEREDYLKKIATQELKNSKFAVRYGLDNEEVRKMIQELVVKIVILVLASLLSYSFIDLDYDTCEKNRKKELKSCNDSIDVAVAHCKKNVDGDCDNINDRLWFNNKNSAIPTYMVLVAFIIVSIKFLLQLVKVPDVLNTYRIKWIRARMLELDTEA